MNFKKSLRSKEIKGNARNVKFVILGFVLILAFFFFNTNLKIDAVSYSISGTNIMGEKNDEEDRIRDSAVCDKTSCTKNSTVDITPENNPDYLSFVQGNGNNNETYVKFLLKNIPEGTTSFAIVETGHSDSVGDDSDLDRYNIGDDSEGNVIWNRGDNKTVNGIVGSATQTTNGIDITYRIRNGGYGLKFFKIFFYDSTTIGASAFSELSVYYVISRPIDLVELGTTCTTANDTICTNYVNGTPTRESRELNIYIPKTVAYVFKSLEGADNSKENYLNTSLNTVYAINYFKETSEGEIETPNPSEIASATQKYLYTNFAKVGDDTLSTVYDLIETKNALYLNYLNSYTANGLEYMQMEVDSTGAYYFYVTDIFGNVSKDIYQQVTDVKNRSIETKILKGNANNVYGYDAEETFTNQSVKVEITMTVQTNFEFGECLDNMCAGIINLTSDRVKEIRYWRVNVEIDESGNDIDAYDDGELPTNEYAYEKYAVPETMRYLYCLNESGCTSYEFDKYNAVNDSNGRKMGSGFVEFEGNKIVMYVANSGRYRFYIEDTALNNTLGPSDNLNVGEFRNPRVEVYGIDKAGPEITFDFESTATNGLKKFDIETFEYYYGIDVSGYTKSDVVCNDLSADISNCYYKGEDNKWHFIYDARIKDGSTTGYIDNYIYYSNDSTLKFDYDKAVKLAKVTASEYIYKYNSANKVLFADFNTYARDTEQYQLSGESNNRFTTIKYNAYNNSNGLKLDNGAFKFKTLTFYHYDNTTKVCEKIGGDYSTEDQYECVNYYLDHGVDFIIEFEAEDAVGNTSTARVYVEIIDTTPPGFVYNAEKKIGRTNTNGNICRIEIGGVIGNSSQTWKDILGCYNVYLGNDEYSFIDNAYKSTANDGLGEENRINEESLHVKLFIKNNESSEWVDLKTTQFIPNRTGYYDIKILVEDYTRGETNSLSILASYYVDKRIVLIEPVANSKNYGEEDPIFEYCAFVGDNTVSNYYEVRFSSNPYSDKNIYKSVYCSASNNPVSDLFQTDTDSTIEGNLSRQESLWYNNNVEGHKADGVTNNYVGVYNIILGTLNIMKDGTPNDDYIVKIYPFDSKRADTKLYGANNGNKIINEAEDGSVNADGLENEPFEDDGAFTESTIKFTIKQVVLNLKANGGSKNYGDVDTNSSDYDDDLANSYLNGISVVSGLKYTDTISAVKGVLRRTVGENVGIYTICNYRGNEVDQNKLETLNNMYIGCNDTYAFDFGGTITYDEKGIIVIDDDFVKSRALYIETNKNTLGRTLNTTTSTRDNNYANYAINYENGNYVINSIDLVLQVAPGQRREYAHGVTHDPNPWEIILYGLVEQKIVKSETGFNGYTVTADSYSASKVDESEEAKLEVNKSEDRTTWNFIHNSKTLAGLKTNETYSLLRSTESTDTNSAKVVRASGGTGGWYLYKELANDTIVGASETEDKSQIAIITNGMNNCTYDTTGHIATVSSGGTSLCKNYNLVYNSKYTTDDGHTIDNKGTHSDEEFIYKSNGDKCTILDPEMPCTDANKYDIQFEIYRRDIIIEFNSAVNTFMDNTTPIIYGHRYNYYESNLFKVDSSTNASLEGHVFLCYADEDNKTIVDCTNNGNYGLTLNDTWSNVGLTFKLHSKVSATTSGYYSDSDKAIPAGVYFVYADIKDEQKENYNFKYKGGTLIIKSKPIDISILDYKKEYGEKTYNGLKVSSDTEWTTICILDSEIRIANDELIGTSDYCGAGFSEEAFNKENIYGFYTSDLDSMDTIADNFVGRPSRDKGEGHDENGMQDSVGIYNIAKGTIKTIINNALPTCSIQTTKGTIGEDCVVVTNGKMPNYVINAEIRNYLIDLYNTSDIEVNVNGNTVTSTRSYENYNLNITVSNKQTEDTVLSETTTDKTISTGKLYITPATLTITVMTGQSKMYGCAYNVALRTGNEVLGNYDYTNGYAWCVEDDGNYYDLGYGYTVSGDKDYQIASSSDFDVTYGATTYNVTGISGTNFRPDPTVNVNAVRNHALNDGTLYRIPFTSYNSETGIKNSTYLQDALKAISGDRKTYQVQSVGAYLIILGSLDASLNGRENQCDGANNPVSGGAYECKNYVINYNGTKVLQGDADVEQTYATTDNLVFNIVQRNAYIYTEYNQKIYGDEDPVIKHTCNDDDVTNHFCKEGEKDTEITYGVSRYYTKANSLAKAPWTDTNIDDYQTNVISGSLSRKGMGNNDPATDDIVGYYEYRYEDFGGTVEIVNANYKAVYYNEDGLAVQEDGTTTMSVQLDGDETLTTKDVKFEIVLRKIKIAFISFDKVYGEKDDFTDYDILVCAPTDTFDFENKRCLKTTEYDPHGLSQTHKETYYDEIQVNSQLIGYKFKADIEDIFKADFIVRYLRAYGENVTCAISDDIKISTTITGNFYNNGDEDNLYAVNLNCRAIAENETYKTPKVETGKMVYETLAYIDQNGGNPGFNYEVSYTTGYVNIVKREIEVTPDSDQGFMYGDYYGTLIPAITYTDSLNATGLRETYGLVNGGADGTGICLNNINYYNNGTLDGVTVGTCYNINDRKDEYDSNTSQTTGVSAAVNAKTGLSGTTSSTKTYVFGDNYESESSERHALNRKYDSSNTNERYNRNVGVYTITQGDLASEINNYKISFVDGVTYTITQATITITPRSNQYKIYGEVDEELKFDVVTKYTVRYTHTNKDGVIVNAGEEITINGFAYEEDLENDGYNYGANKNKQKTSSASINQSSVTGARYFDIACRGATEKGASACSEDRVVIYGDTSKILLGYLHVDWNQAAGKYSIVDGMVVALNGLGENKNYDKVFVEDVKFIIIPRPIGIKINDVSKVYGTSTDKDGCDSGVTNCVANGLTNEDYLKYNFITTELKETLVSSILGDNLAKYKINSSLNIISGLAINESYTQNSGIKDNKNTSSLGVYVSRDELNVLGNACLYDGDKYGFCEDVGEYYLRLYGYANTIDNLNKDAYQSYRPSATLSANTDVNEYYYGTYFGYNPNYFVLLVKNDDSVTQRELELSAVSSTTRDYASLLKSTAKLTITKKDVILYVNTRFNGEKPNQFTIEQNTKAPILPLLNNDIELDYTNFTNNRETAVSSSSSYGYVIWGLHNKQVRTGDKLVGELAYCNQIVNENAYKDLTDNGMTTGYCSSNLIYVDNKNSVNTNLEGYVPIVRDVSMLSISNASGTTENGKTGYAAYENTNYTTTFYPGAITITKDETKPVVEVNHKDVYIEANAIGEYLFECVGANKTTTYIDCNDTKGITIVGKNELNTDDPILKWLNTSSNSEKVVIKVEDFPKIAGCGANNYACTLSAYYQYTYGKGNTSFAGILPQEDLKTLGDFRMWKDEHIKNTGPTSLEELIMTLVSWFGVTSYDEGEIKNGEYLDKQFDKYYYLIIEKEGTNGDFNISRVGNYKIHFYVMDNAGNVSEGNYYDQNGELITTYSNIGTLHIIDTTKPIVGTLNLYNGKVKCIDTDCTKEENWVVAEDTYVGINTLYRYNSDGSAWTSENDVYVDIGETSLVLLSSVTELYIKNSDGTYSQNNVLGKYVRIREGKKASALKHYSWSNSSKGIYLTITDGSDNSYTDATSSSSSQWNHYFSRDGGVTWFLYDRSSTESYLVLAAEGIREIIIKAADQGVKINTATESTSTYVTKAYDDGSKITSTMATYTFTDSSEADLALKTWEETYTSSVLNEMGAEERKEKEQERQTIINRAGWNKSLEAANDDTKAKHISTLIYGEIKSDYEYHRDKQKAYIDWTLPVIEFVNTGSESDNGEKIYIYEFGCEFCTTGYTEKYATGYDATGTTSRETANQGFNRNYSIFMGNGGDYSSISTETLLTSTANSGLGGSIYAMNGNNNSYSIKDITEIERKYVIYVSMDVSDKTGCTYNSTTGYSVCNLSSNIEADNIKNYIQDTISNTYNGDNGDDVTYQIHYFVLDKAGNESSYVSRGIIFSNLVPTVTPQSIDIPIEQISLNAYSLNVSQGDKVENIVNSLSIKASKQTEYLTQTIYYNGELVVDNKRYNKNIYDGFTTSVPGVYEITYNLSYMYYGAGGKRELISADPITLVITVESTPPIVTQKTTTNYTNIILMVSMLLSIAFVVVLLSKKNKRQF